MREYNTARPGALSELLAGDREFMKSVREPKKYWKRRWSKPWDGQERQPNGWAIARLLHPRAGHAQQDRAAGAGSASSAISAARSIGECAGRTSRAYTRKVRKITEQLCFSASAVSGVVKKLSAVGGVLEEPYRYLILDARYEKVREGGVIRSQAVLVAVGVGADGKRAIVGVDGEPRVSSWREFLEGLRRHRGGGAGGEPITPACDRRSSRCWRRRWRRCYALLRNALDHDELSDWILSPKRAVTWRAGLRNGTANTPSCVLGWKRTSSRR